MIRDIRHYQNRIELLEGRTSRDNGNIVKKLKRKIRLLKQKNQSAQ